MSIKCVNIFLIALASILLAPSYSQAQESVSEQQLEVALRMIGHQVLLNAGDSTSRVLPIEKEEGRYRIQFDTEFQFNGEDLVETVNRVIRETEMDRSYIMQVQECGTDKVVYSYQMGDLDNPNIIPCQTRTQEKACYSLVFTLLDFEKPIKSSNTANTETVDSKLFTQLDPEKPIEPSNSVTPGAAETVETDAVESDVVETGVAETAAVEGRISESNQINWPLIALLSALTLGMLIVIYRIRSQSKLDPTLIALGNYQLDKRHTELLFDQERIELTSKEADLLILLYDGVNTTIAREVILRRVWGDEGDYIGRTLDVFISKLRKKLEADPKVKIVNIRGVGYKLVI